MKRNILKTVAIFLVMTATFGLTSSLAFAGVQDTSGNSNGTASSPSAITANCDTSTTQGAIQCGATQASGTTQTAGQATTNVNNTITTIINLLSVAVGIVAVIMIIIGGLRYITSAGSAEGAKGAKSTILYAIIGLVVVALAQVIARFVLNKATGT